LRDYWLSLEIYNMDELLLGRSWQCYPGFLGVDGDGYVGISSFDLQQVMLGGGALNRAVAIFGVCHLPSQRVVSSGRLPVERVGPNAWNFSFEFPARSLPGIVVDELLETGNFPPGLLLEGMYVGIYVGVVGGFGEVDESMVDEDDSVVHCLSSFGIALTPMLTTRAGESVDYWNDGLNEQTDEMALCVLSELVRHSA